MPGSARLPPPRGWPVPTASAPMPAPPPCSALSSPPPCWLPCSTGRGAGVSAAAAATVCSMAPKIEWRLSSFISMRTRSPKRRNGVFGCAAQDGLDRAQLGDAGIAERRPRPPACPARRPGLLETVPEPMIVPAPSGRVLAAWAISVAEIEGHVDAGIGRPNGLPFRSTMQRPVQLAAVPGVAQLVGRHRHRREGRGRLRLEEAEALGQLAPGSGCASDTSLTSMTRRIAASASSRRRAHRHVAGDHGDLGLQVDAPGFVGQRDRVARAEEAVRAALVHQRIGPEALPASRRRAPCAPARRGSHRPSRRPTDRRAAAAQAQSCSWKRARRHRAVLELLGQIAAACGATRVPVVERRLQRRRDVGASVERVRSRETTTSLPSRVPFLSVASFIGLPLSKLLLQPLPAIDVVSPAELSRLAA